MNQDNQTDSTNTKRDMVYTFCAICNEKVSGINKIYLVSNIKQHYIMVHDIPYSQIEISFNLT